MWRRKELLRIGRSCPIFFTGDRKNCARIEKEGEKALTFFKKTDIMRTQK